MNDLKIGDRVRVVLGNEPIETSQGKIINGATGTVKELGGISAGIEFDDYIGGHDGLWNGKDGYCWYMLYERLEKIEETATEEIKEDEGKRHEKTEACIQRQTPGDE